SHAAARGRRAHGRRALDGCLWAAFGRPAGALQDEEAVQGLEGGLSPSAEGGIGRGAAGTALQDSGNRRAAPEARVFGATQDAAQLVALDAVVVGELEHRAALLAVVADEGELVLLLWTVGGAQQLHTEHFGIELDRALQVADAQHGMQDPHLAPWKMGREAAASSSRSRASRQSGYSAASRRQKRFEWLSSRRWVTSCATT